MIALFSMKFIALPSRKKSSVAAKRWAAAYNQMVVKCVFSCLPIEKIVGADESRNDDLLRMLGVSRGPRVDRARSPVLTKLSIFGQNVEGKLQPVFHFGGEQFQRQDCARPLLHEQVRAEGKRRCKSIPWVLGGAAFSHSQDPLQALAPRDFRAAN
jgi:hypothetical protein